MASPLSTLRKYQFGFFVFFGVVCMLVFVIGDPLNQWLSSRGGGQRSENKVVVSWRGGELRENEIGNTQQVRNVIREFIRTLLEETQKKNGIPRVQMLSLSPSEEDIVYTKLLAQRAEAMGMVVSDETALIYLEQLTATLIPRSGIGSMFQETVGGRITEQQLLGEIKSELLAQNYLSLTYPDLTQGQLPVQAWEYHRRLHRRVKAEVVPVNAADFKSKVTKQPTDAEIEALYTAAKDRYPDPASPEPGFKRHRKAAFEFARADRKKFEQEETEKLKPQITDPEIQGYYDKNKEEFRIQEAPPEQPKPETKSEEKPAEKKAESTADPQPPAEKPAAEKPAAEKPAAEKPAAEKPATEKVDEKKNDTPAEPTKPKDANPDPACGSDQEVNKSATESADQAAAPSTEKQAEKAAAPATPAGEKKSEDAPVSADKKANAEKAEKKDEAKVEDKPAPPAPAPAPAAAPAGEQPAAVPPVAPGTTPPVPVKPEPKYKPLDDKVKEEIRAKIAEQKARQAAQQRIGKGFDEIKRSIEKFARDKRSAELTGKSAPQPVDLAKLAQSHAMTSGNIPLADPKGIQESELGKTQDVDFATMSFQPIPFHVLAYRDGIPLWKPEQIRGSTVDGNPDVEFMYWKTKEEDPFVPELKDIRAEVVEAWKLREALTLAQAEAKSLGDKARQSGKPLKEVFADNKELKVAETNQFSWMTRGFLPANMGGAPSLSSVDNVEFAGQEFMRSVFRLQTGEVGTAVNQPQSIVYVVRIESELPSEDALREQFLQSGSSTELRQIASFDRMEVQRSWFEALRREMNVVWERTPQS